MGYYTSFVGELSITPRLSEDHFAYLSAFTNTRRMARDEEIVKGLPDPLREAVGLPVGTDGAYYVEDLGGKTFSEDRDAGGVLAHNDPPGGQLSGFIIPTGTVHTSYGATVKFGPRCLEPLNIAGNGHRTGLGGDDNIPTGHHCEFGVWREYLDDRQPGLWAEWMVGEDADTLWMGDEPQKAYDFEVWLKYLIERFFTPWGYMLNGTVEWSGEEDDDLGKIEVVNNIITIYEAQVTYVRR